MAVCAMAHALQLYPPCNTLNYAYAPVRFDAGKGAGPFCR